MQQPSRPPYWFRARRSGRGWGLPSSLPGWIFFLGWLVVLLLIVRSLKSAHPFEFALALGLWGLVYVAVCLAKGEPMPARQDRDGT